MARSSRDSARSQRKRGPPATFLLPSEHRSRILIREEREISLSRPETATMAGALGTRAISRSVPARGSITAAEGACPRYVGTG